MAVTSKVTDKKREYVKNLAADLKAAKGIVLTNYRGLTVAKDTELRRELRAAGVTYRVVKEAGLSGFDEHLADTTALAFSTEDAVAPAKIICGFMKKNKLEDPGILTIKVGAVEGKVIDVKGVKALASLPSREELIAKLLGSMNAPIANFVGVSQGIIRQFVQVLNAVAEKKATA